jgi:hypothetical protein
MQHPAGSVELAQHEEHLPVAQRVPPATDDGEGFFVGAERRGVPRGRWNRHKGAWANGAGSMNRLAVVGDADFGPVGMLDAGDDPARLKWHPCAFLGGASFAAPRNGDAVDEHDEVVPVFFDLDLRPLL